MKEWGTDEAPAKNGGNSWWRDRWNDLDPKHQWREDVLVAMGGLVYLGVLGWPLYRLVFADGATPENMSIVGGLVGLLLASYAVMSDRVEGTIRGLLAAIGILAIIACWGFGPL